MIQRAGLLLINNAEPEGQHPVDEGRSTIVVSVEAEKDMYSRYSKDTSRITCVGPEGETQEMESLHAAGTGNDETNTAGTIQCTAGQPLEQSQPETIITPYTTEPVLIIPPGFDERQEINIHRMLHDWNDQEVLSMNVNCKSRL